MLEGIKVEPKIVIDRTQPPSTEIFPRMKSGLYKPMSTEGTTLFAEAGFMELGLRKAGKTEWLPIAEHEKTPIMHIIGKRIEVMGLPIKITPLAYCAMEALVRYPGEAVVCLMDCLTMFEHGTIDIDKLSQVYPLGFYNQETFDKYVDDYAKKRKILWAEVYGARS